MIANLSIDGFDSSLARRHLPLKRVLTNCFNYMFSPFPKATHDVQMKPK